MMEGFKELLANSELLQGGLILTVLTAAMVYLRRVPQVIGKHLQRLFTANVHFRDQDIVHWVGQWLATGEYAQRCRRLNCRLDHQGKLPAASMEPGLGVHYFRYKKHWILLRHALEEEGEAATALFEKKRTMTMWTIGRRSTVIRQVVDDAIGVALSRRKGKQVTHINYNGDFWQEVRADDQRPLESVILNCREQIMDDTAWFLKNSEWYTRRGLPYRRGYLFHGPPGNGKSTMIQVLAGHFELPIYMLTLTGESMSDSNLYGLMANIPRRAILAIEDIDKTGFDRTGKKGVTLSGLLNAICGIVAGYGRLLIITANETSKLPDTLIRKGRIDKTWFIDIPGEVEVATMFKVFYPDADGYADAFSGVITPAGLSMAAIQQYLVRWPTPQDAVENTEEIVGSQ